MKMKTFDCVEMKHQAAERIQKKISQMSPKEEKTFWQERTAELKKQKEQLQIEVREFDKVPA